MRFMFAVLVLAIAGAILAGCSGLGGPCVHVYRDTVVHVGAVVDSSTSSGIDSVFITKVAVRGDSLPLYLVAYSTNGHEAGVLLDGDTLRCRVPCAFGSSEGRWEVTLLARGYPVQTVAFDASYGVYHGGCPSYNDRGSLVVLHLSRTLAR